MADGMVCLRSYNAETGVLLVVADDLNVTFDDDRAVRVQHLFVRGPDVELHMHDGTIRQAKRSSVRGVSVSMCRGDLKLGLEKYTRGIYHTFPLCGRGVRRHFV